MSIVHSLLNIALGIAIVSAIYGAAREPGLAMATMFGLVTLELAFVMRTVLLAAQLRHGEVNTTLGNDYQAGMHNAATPAGRERQLPMKASMGPHRVKPRSTAARVAPHSTV